MSTARHVDSTNPERVRVMMATGHVRDGRTTLRMECSWCGKIIVHGPDDAPVSHGACPTCARRMVAEIAVRSLSDLIEAVAVDGRHSPRAVKACRLTTQCIRDIVTVGVHENGRRAGDRPATPAVSPPEEADSRNLAGRSDPSKPYVVTVGSPGGVVDERFYSGFAAMVMGARELAERYCHPSRVVVCGNWDRADVDEDGLTDAERGLLEELL